MVVYVWLLFGHLVGVALLLGGVGAYALSIERLRHATAVREVRALLQVASLGERLLLVGGPLLIAAGLGLAAGFWSLAHSWIVTSIGLVAFQGGWSLVAEIRMRRLWAAIREAPDGPLDVELRHAARDPMLRVANRISAAVIIEILFLMVVKPTPFAILWSLLIAAAGTVLACLPVISQQRRRTADAQEPHASARGSLSSALAPAEPVNDPRPAPGKDQGYPPPPQSLDASDDVPTSVRQSTPNVIPLAELSRADARVAGAKAATLGEATRAGFPVPDGFVVIGQPDEGVSRALAALGDAPLAVRSSAIAEDLAGASFAGQYESILNVRGPAALLAAIRQVRDSTRSARVQHYRAARAGAEDDGIAVLVQRMLASEAAGVAFTANPVTGARGEVVITAARGLGERVVSGEAVGDEWVVREDGEAICRRAAESAIDADQALAVAQLARRVEAYFGVPQDIEWAIEAGQVYLLQARPMTALPEPVDWTPPSPGYWMRNFRLGEWLSEPMTPLFQDWLLERLEEGHLLGMRRTAGAVVPWRHAAINGWYYTAAPSPSAIPLTLTRAILQSRGRVLPFLLNALVRVNSRPEAADRAVLDGLARAWRNELLPRYRRLIEDRAPQIETATPGELAELIDVVGCTAGEYLWSLAIVGGSAWKMEGCLARFLRQHVPTEVYGSVQVLLRGLPGADPEVPAHAVQSVDWYWPTAGELGWSSPDPALTERRRQLAAEREVAEAACRAALADKPGLLARFEMLLEVAQRYAAIREEQARWFTLGWPLLRRCALRLGETVRARGAIDRAEDVFFLTRAELHGPAHLQEVVSRRRAEWERRRRLIAPLTIGTAPLVERVIRSTVNAVRTGGQVPDGSIVGQPASPGRATGPVRIVRGPEDFDRFRPGEVLVARTTAPAWTPLFGRAAAVVTDGGTLAAHASLVAREYGIPAVVGAGDATTRLRDGQVVVVDGSAGTVQPQPHQASSE